jgi:hypothetical protein
MVALPPAQTMGATNMAVPSPAFRVTSTCPFGQCCALAARTEFWLHFYFFCASLLNARRMRSVWNARMLGRGGALAVWRATQW